MKKVVIQYQPFKWLKYNRFMIGQFPSEWSETSPKQLIAIACLLKHSISDVHFIAAMTGLSLSIVNRLDDFQRYQLIELFDSFRSDEPFNYFIIPELDCKSTVLLAPKSKLQAITFAQFIFMDTYFVNYQQSAKPEDLNKFIASTYLPYGQRFAEHIVEINHEWVAKADLLTKEAIVINYHLIRDWLTKVYPLVFSTRNGNSDDSDASDDSTGSKKPNRPDNNSWIKVFENIVGDDIVNHDRYAELPIHNVLRFLSSKIKENLKRK